MAEHRNPLPLGRWAVEVYGRPGVEDACLTLQDRHGMDVVAVLGCAWAGAHHGTIDADRLATIVADLGSWRDEVVAPLRAVRRRIKRPDALGTNAAACTGASAAARERLRGQVAEVELAAEVVQLDEFEARTVAVVGTGHVGGSPGSVAMRTNLACLAAVGRDEPDPGLQPAIDALLLRITAAEAEV